MIGGGVLIMQIMLKAKVIPELCSSVFLSVIWEIFVILLWKKKQKDLNEDVFMVLGLNCGMMFMGIKMCNQIYF